VASPCGCGFGKLRQNRYSRPHIGPVLDTIYRSTRKTNRTAVFCVVNKRTATALHQRHAGLYGAIAAMPAAGLCSRQQVVIPVAWAPRLNGFSTGNNADEIIAEAVQFFLVLRAFPGCVDGVMPDVEIDHAH